MTLHKLYYLHYSWNRFFSGWFVWSKFLNILTRILPLIAYTIFEKGIFVTYLHVIRFCQKTSSQFRNIQWPDSIYIIEDNISSCLTKKSTATTTTHYTPFLFGVSSSNRIIFLLLYSLPILGILCTHYEEKISL